MGNCMKKKSQSSEQQISLYLFGLDDAGKTTISKVLANDFDLNDIVPTVGYQPVKFNYKKFAVNIIESGGGERVRDLYKHYVAESFGFIYVIDSSNQKRLEECKRELHKFMEHEKVAGKAILILGNKQDKANAMDESELVELLRLEEISNKTSTLCRVEMCVGTGKVKNKIDDSIKLGFEWLMSFINTNYETLKLRVDRDVQYQKAKEERERKEKEDKFKQRKQMMRSTIYESDEPDPDPDEFSNKFNNGQKSPMRGLSDKENGHQSLALSNIQPNSNRSIYDKKLDLKPSPRSRLNPIEEEKPKLRLGNKFINNKLSPTNDLYEFDIFSNSKQTNAKNGGTSWAITDNFGSNKRSTLAPF